MRAGGLLPFGFPRGVGDAEVECALIELHQADEVIAVPLVFGIRFSALLLDAQRVQVIEHVLRLDATRRREFAHLEGLVEFLAPFAFALRLGEAGVEHGIEVRQSSG